jgi:hypothetical protein
MCELRSGQRILKRVDDVMVNGRVERNKCFVAVNSVTEDSGSAPFGGASRFEHAAVACSFLLAASAYSRM